MSGTVEVVATCSGVFVCVPQILPGLLWDPEDFVNGYFSLLQIVPVSPASVGI